MFLALVFALSMSQPADTLRAGVFHPVVNHVLVTGATHDLSLLHVQYFIVLPGDILSTGAKDHADHLLIVRNGQIGIDVDTRRKLLGPGGVVLLPAGKRLRLNNTGKDTATFYIFAFRPRSNAQTRDTTPLLLNWPDLSMRKTDKGESRAIFSRPGAWLKNINMHATTLDPGQISHPQHVHRNEEIILMRSGHVRMHIADKYYTAGPGDLVFLPSGVPHNLENGKDGRCEYFALQWSQ